MAGTDRRQAAGSEAGPAVILVEPQMGENIGAAARAMLNCGLTDLRLVRPRDGWPSPKAVASASGADAVLEAARLHDRTADAMADCAMVFATTARGRDMLKPVMTPKAAAAEMRALAAGGSRVGILFGPERTGLTNDDVALADIAVTVPLNPAFASLNLAQAVLLLAYEWRMAADGTPPLALDYPPDAPPASKALLFNLFAHLETELDARGFFRVAEKRPSMQRNIRAMLERARLSEQEVRTLHGVIVSLAGPRHG
jgi:tRNA/rRNA methyltransferase